MQKIFYKNRIKFRKKLKLIFVVTLKSKKTVFWLQIFNEFIHYPYVITISALHPLLTCTINLKNACEAPKRQSRASYNLIVSSAVGLLSGRKFYSRDYVQHANKRIGFWNSSVLCVVVVNFYWLSSFSLGFYVKSPNSGASPVDFPPGHHKSTASMQEETEECFR